MESFGPDLLKGVFSLIDLNYHKEIQNKKIQRNHSSQNNSAVERKLISTAPSNDLNQISLFALDIIPITADSTENFSTNRE